MKIRQGFVSNSSSSSYVIVGRYLDLEDITPEMLEEKEIFTIACHDLSEGEDVAELNEETLRFYQNFECEEVSFVEAVTWSWDGDPISFRKEDLEDDCNYEIYSGYASYYSSETLENLFDIYQNYYDKEFDPKDYEKIVLRNERKKKLERIKGNEN